MAEDTNTGIGRSGADYVKKIENINKQLDTMHAEYMLECKDVRDDLRNLYKDAKADGVPLKSLKVAVKKREYARKSQEITIGLDLDEMSQLDKILRDLGDLVGTPLADAAIKQAKNGDAARANT